jgi:hypothetical protein
MNPKRRGDPALYLDESASPIGSTCRTSCRVRLADRRRTEQVGGCPRFGARAWAARLPAETEPARAQPAASRAPKPRQPLGSCAAGLGVPSPMTRRPGRTFPDSGLPDNGRVVMQVYIKLRYRGCSYSL